jgi:hypothetical protein
LPNKFPEKFLSANNLKDIFGPLMRQKNRPGLRTKGFWESLVSPIFKKLRQTTNAANKLLRLLAIVPKGESFKANLLNGPF